MAGNDIRDNFFDLGGDSMLAAKLTAQFCEEFQVNLPIQVLFQSGTIAELAARWIERAFTKRKVSSPW